MLGKYRILRKIGSGGFADVYAARDTIEGVDVALKIPLRSLLAAEILEVFRHEVRITSALDHTNILALKNADFVDGRFVIANRLGERTLADRLKHRLSLEKALLYSEQMLEAMAYAHNRRVVHLDLKPENMILFDGDHLRITDFGIAKVMQRTMMSASGSGTVGFIAPEQAMGRPSFRSDVFSLGLVMWRMLSGELPRWPYEWPPAGAATLRRKVPASFVQMLQRALEVDERYRYQDARRLRDRFREIAPDALTFARRQRARRRRRER
jgi:serine/threonine-protein kinase